MPYIGNIPADKFLTLAKQSFSTSATTSYTLDSAVSSTQDIALFINNVRQSPVDAYSVSGTSLTLTSATAGTDEMYCVYLGKTVGTVSPSVNSITNAMMTDDSVGLAELSATGTASSSNFLRGDNSWAIPTGNGKILQVVSATYATEVSSTDSSSWTDSGLSLAITPSSTSSKVLFIISQHAFVTRSSSLARGLFRVLRGSTTVFDSANWTINMQQTGSDLSHSTMLSFTGLDSPSSTSALTYKSQILPEASTTIKAQQSNHPSTITLLEVGA